MNVRIRRGTPEDRDMIWKATMETVWNDLSARERERLDRGAFEEHFRPRAREVIESAANVVLVAEDGAGRFLGYLILGAITSMLSPIPFGFVYDVWVAPEARRQGVATTLLDHAVRWCRTRGVGSLKLEVSAHNDVARELYASFGFAEERLFLSVPSDLSNQVRQPNPNP